MIEDTGTQVYGDTGIPRYRANGTRGYGDTEVTGIEGVQGILG